VLAIFAAVALTMAGVAIYGVMAYAARLRRREIGVRIALGSTRLQALGLIARDGVVAVGIGVTCGLLMTVWLTGSLAGALSDLSTLDPIALLAVTALLVGVGLAAAIVPARRAAWSSPLDAIRTE
jgi:ABC-type antimicrobial peptide transport system permease subunit